MDGASSSQQVLTFTLGPQTYGVDILRVREIRGWSEVTRIPQSPPHVLGVLNLRGSIIPIVDLRKRFDLAKADYSVVTVIIVLSVECAAGRRDLGMVVDGVSDVIEISAAALHPTPDLGVDVSSEFIQGLVTVGEDMLMLLDIDRLLGGDLGAVTVPLVANG